MVQWVAKELREELVVLGEAVGPELGGMVSLEERVVLEENVVIRMQEG